VKCQFHCLAATLASSVVFAQAPTQQAQPQCFKRKEVTTNLMRQGASPVVAGLSGNPQGRIPFKGLIGKKPGSQHSEISGNQTIHVKGSRKEIIDGDYTLKVKRDYKIEAGGRIMANGVRIDLG
jgi:hypothetical protein